MVDKQFLLLSSLQIFIARLLLIVGNFYARFLNLHSFLIIVVYDMPQKEYVYRVKIAWELHQRHMYTLPRVC